MQQVFKSAIYHHEPIVLNRQLMPLSLGHCMILLAAESPFMTSGDCSLEDLAFSVSICSRSYEDALRMVHDPEISAAFYRWGSTCGEIVFKNEKDRFDKYFNDSIIMPERFSSGNGSAVLHPWPLAIAVSIMPMVGESRAWNMPFALAVSYWSANAEMTHDDKSLLSDRDQMMLDIERAKAKAKAEG